MAETAKNRDVQSIFEDARWERDRVEEFKKELFASKRIEPKYLQAFTQEIEHAEALAAKGTNVVHDKQSAHAKQLELAGHLVAVLSDVREDYVLAFPGDKAKQHAAGVGAQLDAGRPEQLLATADAVRMALAQHPDDVKVAHVDAQHLHDLGTLTSSLRGAISTHGKMSADRHDAALALDHLLHVLQARAAHVRLVAKRVFKADPVKLARFKSPVKHHVVTNRAAAGRPATGV